MIEPAILPLVLVGETRSKSNLAALANLGWGRMFVVQRPTPFPFERWGFDNGAFGGFLRGTGFPEDDFRRRLETAQDGPGDPHLAVAPDIVAGGLQSLDFSLKWRTSELRAIDWPWYLAVQDGMTPADVRPHLHLFSGIFLGGTDRFKATAYRWRTLAHAHQMKFHYARASTPGKLLSAFKIGADSCDSAFPLWTAARMKLFSQRWSGLLEQMPIHFA